MKSRIFVLMGQFITSTLQITPIRDDAIYGRHLSVSAFDVSIYDIVCHYSCQINLINRTIPIILLTMWVHI